MDSGNCRGEVTDPCRLPGPDPTRCGVVDPRKRVPVPSQPPPLVARIEIVRDPRGLRDLPLERGRSAEDYEFQIITVPRESSVSQVRAALTEHAEYGRWEHARTRKYLGGGRKVWMRRRIVRVESALGADLTD